MPIESFEVPGHPDLLIQKGAGRVTLDEAIAMKREEMSAPAVPGRRYLTDIRGCEFDADEIREWPKWNAENVPREYLGRVAYLADEPRVTAFMMVLASNFDPTREAAVFSTLQGALEYLEAGATVGELLELGLEDD